MQSTDQVESSAHVENLNNIWDIEGRGLRRASRVQANLICDL